MAKQESNKSAPTTVKTSEVRLNSDMVNFLAEVIATKINSEGNVDKIKELYEEHVGLRFTNISRVIARTNRKGLVEIKAEMLASKDCDPSDVKDLEVMLKTLGKEKSHNYMTVQVPAE